MVKNTILKKELIMNDEEIKKALGDSVNPAYVNKILEKDATAFLEWLARHLEDSKPTIAESLVYAYAIDYENKEALKPTLIFGIKILESRFKRLSFFLEELKSKLEAENIDV